MQLPRVEIEIGGVRSCGLLPRQSGNQKNADGKMNMCTLTNIKSTP